MNFTFDSIKTTLKNRLSLLSNWANILYYGTYERIIDVVSFAVHRLAYLAEVYYRESFWGTAQKIKNLVMLGTFIGYVPHRKIAAVGKLIITADSTGFYNDYTYSGVDIIIPKWTQFTDTSEKIFAVCTTESIYQAGTISEKLAFNNGVNVDEGSSLVSFPISYAGSFAIGDEIYISGTQNYDGFYEIINISNTKVYIESTYFEETITNSMFMIKGLFSVHVKEGEVKDYTYTAGGALNETIKIYSDSIDEDEVQVDITDALGNVINTVSICGKNGVDTKLYYLTDLTGYYCEIKSMLEFNGIEVKFGDGVYGRKLTAGQTVRVRYLQTKGDLGNILSTGVIVKNKTKLYDGAGALATLYITNNSEISNGNSVEEIEHIRNYGNKIFFTGYRCGGYDDWLTIIGTNANVAKVKIANMEDIGSIDDSDVNKVFVTAISTDGSKLTTIQKNAITAELKDENKKSVTEIISWRDPVVIYLLGKIVAKIENQPFSVVTALVKNSLTDNYGILNTDFQTNIYQSNYIRIIDSTQYIKYNTSEIKYLEKNFSREVTNHKLLPIYTTLNTAILEDQIFLLENTLEVYIFRKRNSVWDSTPYLIAKDIAGTIVGQQGDLPAGTYIINNSAINYLSGYISFSVQDIIDNPMDYGVKDPQLNDVTGYVLSIAYRTKDGNGAQLYDIRLPEDRFITDVDSNYVLCSFDYM